MHINTDMGISDCSTASSASAAYATQHEMAPYSAQVSSFTLPTSSDTLLTPTSLSGSPSSRHLSFFNSQRHQHQHQQPYNRKAHFTLPTASAKSDNPAKSMTLIHSPPMSHTAHHHYPQPQQPTPPASGMNYSYENVSEAPPIGAQTSGASGYDMNNYPYHSPKDDGLPTTMDGYPFNSYTATAPPPPAEEATGSSPMYAFTSGISGNSQYMGQPQQRLPPPNPAAYSQYAPPPQHGHHHHHQQHHPQGLAPLLSHPRPQVYRSDRPMVSDYPSAASIPSMSPGHHSSDGRRLPPAAASSDHSRTPRTQAGSIGDVNNIFQPNGTTNGAGPNGTSNSSSNIQNTVTTDMANLIVTDSDEMELNEKASQEEHDLFNLHKSLRGHRGKGMWEAITQKHREMYPDLDHTTARLQMKYTRAVRRHGRYPRPALEQLLRTYDAQEKNKYARYASLMKEEGNDSNFDWKPADIEAAVCRLGFEDPTQDQGSKLRRRHQIHLRRQQRMDSSQQAQAQPSAVAPAWNNSGYVPGNQQYPLPSPHQPHVNAMQDAYEIVPVMLSDEQQTALIDSLEEKYAMSDCADDGTRSNHSNSPVDHAMSNGASDAGSSVYPRPLPSPNSGHGLTFRPPGVSR